MSWGDRYQFTFEDMLLGPSPEQARRARESRHQQEQREGQQKTAQMLQVSPRSACAILGIRLTSDLGKHFFPDHIGLTSGHGARRTFLRPCTARSQRGPGPAKVPPPDEPQAVHPLCEPETE